MLLKEELFVLANLPCSILIIMEVDQKVRSVEGVTDVNVMLTFDPPWNRELMSEEAKLELGFL